LEGEVSSEYSCVRNFFATGRHRRDGGQRMRRWSLIPRLKKRPAREAAERSRCRRTASRLRTFIPSIDTSSPAFSRTNRLGTRRYSWRSLLRSRRFLRGSVRVCVLIASQSQLLKAGRPRRARAMANAPQKPARAAQTSGDAPPARAATAPSTTRHNNETADTTTTLGGKTTMVRIGTAAPAVNVAADANAACNGRAA